MLSTKWSVIVLFALVSISTLRKGTDPLDMAVGASEAFATIAIVSLIDMIQSWVTGKRIFFKSWT